MATTIAYVRKEGNGFIGTAKMLNYQGPIAIRPLQSKITADGPDYGIYTDTNIELGTARNKTSQAGKPYVAGVIKNREVVHTDLFFNLAPAAGQDEPDVFAALVN